MSQPDHCQEELVCRLKVKVIAPSNGAPTSGALKALAANGCKRCQQSRQDFFVPGYRNAGHRLEYGRIGPQAFEP
jgi:hypothetical protein